MKKIVFLLLVLVSITNSCFGQIRAKVDERFELTSIAFMLAGAPEYCDCRISSYKQDIEDRLGKYRSSESIKFMRELNQSHEIGYNAITNVADLLQIKNGIISLQPQYDISKISERDSRWNESLMTKYIVMLNRFYKESKFKRFFSDHSKLYQVAEERMNTLLDGIATGWFEDFFGTSLEALSLEVYISLANGPNNYAVGNSVLIGLYEDEEGLPNPNDSVTTPMLIHEWGHHFTNPIALDYWPQLEKAAEQIYPRVESVMNQFGYSGAQAMVIEWLNNLFSIMYYRETAPQYVPSKTAHSMFTGFIWIDRNVSFMADFYANRNLYPHIEEFMPQLVAFFDYVAQQFDIIYREYKNGYPFITNIYPAFGTDITGFDQIVITFSKPMLGSWGVQGTGTDDENVKGLYEVIDEIVWSEDYMQAYLLLNKEKVEPNQIYGLRLFPSGFYSANYFPLDEMCANLLFNTGQK